ncbi:MAG: DUF177 domain-containing protein [Bacteroidales bacterium]|nr:DUF177 domain-containing protein [Bacteroidales bacterium]
MDEKFVIGLDGLKAGSSRFDWRADGKFFGEFENSEILDASLDVGAEVTKTASFIGIDCTVKGTVTVTCDRCLADLVLPVDELIRLSVRYGAESETPDEDGREVVFLPDRETGLDMGQILYDYVCTGLPLVRVHPDGACDPEVVRYLGTPDAASAPAAESQNPFASLKTLLEKK